MNRRGFVALAGGLAGVPTVPSVGARGMTEEHAGSRCDEEIERTDWVPHYTVSIEPDGQATVELSVEGSDVPGDIGLGTGQSNVIETLTGEAALDEREWGLLWDTSVADTVAHRVELGVYESGNIVAEVFDDAVFTVVNELVAPTGWKGGIDALPEVHRFTIDAPNGWTATFSGDQVGPNTYEVNPRIPLDQFPREVIPVGDFDVHTREVDGTTLRAVSLPAADGIAPETALDLWAEAVPRLEHYYQEAPFPKLGVIVPAPEGRIGGQGREHTFVVTDNVPLIDPEDRAISPALGELGRTYQRHDQPRWYLDGSNGWVLRAMLAEIGRLSEDELREHLKIAGTEGGLYVGDPYEVPATETRWKATPVLAALDMDVRARTDGAVDYADLLARTHDPRPCGSYTVERERILTALVTLTGVEYTAFFERFVDGSEYPDVVLTDDFSITDPTTVAFGPALSYGAPELSSRELRTGEEVSVTTELENVGSAAVTSTVTFRVAGTAVGTTDVALEPDESTEIAFDHEFTEPGTHRLALDRYDLGTVSVSTALTSTATSTVEPVPETSTEEPTARTDETTESSGAGFGWPGAIGAIGGAAFLLLRRLTDDE